MDSGFMFSIITAAIAIGAICQTQYQIRVSNKCHLFDKRMRVYTISDGLIELCLSNYHFLCREKEDKPLLAMDLQFIWLTNNAYLENTSPAIKYPLKDPITHKALLMKLEELKILANETRFLFSDKSSLALVGFINSYHDLLFSIYQYQILLSNIRENIEQFNWTLEEASERLQEPEQREKLYTSIDALKESYDAIKGDQIMEKLEKQIRFIK